MKRWIVGILVVILAVTVVERWMEASEWQETAERYERQREEAEKSLEIWRDSARAAEERADSARQAAERAQNRAEERIQRAERAVEEAEEAETRASSSADSAFRALKGAIRADKPNVVLLSLLNEGIEAENREDSAQNEQIRQKDRIIADKDSVIAAKDGRIWTLEASNSAKDSVIAELGHSLEISERQRKRWKAEAKPGVFDLGMSDVIRDAGFAVLGYAIGKL